MQDILPIALQIVPAVSIIIGIILFYVELRRSRIDKGYDTYVRTLLSLIDIEKMFIQYPELQDLWTSDQSYRQLTAEKRTIFHWSVLLFDLFEIVFISSPLNRGWMGQDEWDGWSRFVSSFFEDSEDFRFAWTSNREVYSKKYREYVDGLHTNAIQMSAKNPA
ncbi:MAG: hypothetical protein ACXAEB_04935 [Candidatus Thorarchaeota archaeon]|jgi:hypothetical protein